MGAPKDAGQSANYDAIGYDNVYQFFPGVCLLPLAEEPPTDPNALANWSPVVTLQLHAPYRIRRARYVAEKTNNPPVVPAPGDAGKFVFLGGTLDFVNNLNTTFRNFDWRVNGDFLYVESCVSRNQDGFVLGDIPWREKTAHLNAQSYSSQAPQVGAVSEAGPNVVVGYNQGQSIVASQSGALKPIWGYNTAAFFPGTLLSDDMVNG